jgi:hypothetical protein
MKKLAVLISLLAFVFVASVTTSHAQTTVKDDAKSEKTTVTTSKVSTDEKAPCAKITKKKQKCSHKKAGHKCAGAKKAPCKKPCAKKSDAVKNDDAVIEEKDKKK